MEGSQHEALDPAELLARAKAGGPPTVTASDERSSGGSTRRLATFAIVFALLGGAVAVLLSGEESPFVYSQAVHEVVADPAAFAGRTLRVEGKLQAGSILYREDPCEYRFVLESEGRSMPVEFPQCIVPDTFRDGMGITVVVEGGLREDGTFLASQVIPRCPSKYEMEQAQQNGEAMPHAPADQPFRMPEPPS